MRGTRIGLLTAMVALLLVAEPCVSSAGPPTVAGTDDPAAITMLRDAARAGTTARYSGTQFSTSWGPRGASAMLAQVEHDPGTGTRYRVVGGGPTEATIGDISDPSLVEFIVAGYDVEIAGTGTVAGRGATVIDLRRGDGTLAARLWTDSEAGLLLRREVYDEGAKLVRASGFLDIDLQPGAAADASSMSVTVSTARGTQTAQVPSGPTLPARLGTSMRLLGSSRMTVDEAEVTHLLYTDGLSSVSVFYQRGSLDDEKLDGFDRRTIGETSFYVAQDEPLRVTWACYGYVYTVVADASSTSLDTMLQALPHSADVDDGFRARVERGLQRVGAWLNPFG